MIKEWDDKSSKRQRECVWKLDIGREVVTSMQSAAVGEPGTWYLLNSGLTSAEPLAWDVIFRSGDDGHLAKDLELAILDVAVQS